MAKSYLLAFVAAGIALTAAAEAHAQPRDSIFRQRSSQTPADQQLSIDVSQYSPEARMGKLLQGMDQLLRQNQQLQADLAAAKAQLDKMERRMESISNVLTTGSGESIGSMVRKIKDKTVGPY